MRLPPRTIELPSGRIVTVSMVIDPRRLWEIQAGEVSACTIVRRTQGRSGMKERLKEVGQRGGGLVLHREDAHALMAVLLSPEG